MKHSTKFQRIKGWYDDGHWTKKMVANAVIMGWITEIEFFEITNEIYT